MEECGVTWKAGWVSRIADWLIRHVEREDEPHRVHRCFRPEDHNSSPYTAVHMCRCTSTHYYTRR